MTVRAAAPVRALSAVTLVLLLAGCSQSNHGPRSDPATPQVPAFTGPWAAEFATSYAAATTDLVRDILKDSKVTDAEWAETKERYVNCLADRGIPLTWVDDYGSFKLDGETAAGTSVDDALNTCGANFDFVDAMRYAIARNPQNLDESEIVVACFIKNGIVDPGYTSKQYEIDINADPLPDWLSSGKATPCIRDPLGVLQ